MKLLPHQTKHAQFLANYEFAGLFDGMGTGKTITALEAARKVGASRVLIIGPPISLSMWKAEASVWLGEECNILATGKTPLNECAVQICSYVIATKRAAELREWLGACKDEVIEATSVMIFDEGHACKNVAAKRTVALLGRNGIADGADFAWDLTGTPETRWHDDLYPFLCRADLAGLKSRCGGSSMEKFLLRYCVTQMKRYPGARFLKKVVVGNRNTAEMNEWIYGGDDPLAVRAELTSVWEAMPPVTFNRYPIPLDSTPELKDKLREMAKKTMAQMEADIRRNRPGNAEEPALATVRRMLGQAKVKAFVQEVWDRHDANPTAPILVGAWHRDVIDEVCKALEAKSLRTVALTGSTNLADKGRIETQFNAGAFDVLVGQIGAMGVSLNMQKGGACNIMVIEEDWSPSIMDQFYARLYRMGQINHVHVDTYYADVKLELAVARIALAKRREHSRLNRQEETV